ncbi:LADA_0E00496g1_1 [Lachancea dasiensis]|uniref:LADA_0E00496g1_1 n=1 Tax=Lachancea dasiensis TaxID=1072105 RepID=A0A1G4JA76_9SACH|nr:LADA_0E00496g1_1 [Lachancea dasiensis]
MSEISEKVEMTEVEIPVLVLGGSLVGLSAGLFLADCGVPCIVIEKHLGSSPHPRAIGYTEHTMEFFRHAGLGDLIPHQKPGMRLRRVRATSLFGQWFEESSWSGKPNAPKLAHFSPCTGAAIAQDKLEPLLRTRASQLGCDIRQKTTLLEFKQNDGNVEATVRDEIAGHSYKIKAQYMIAADGAKSSTREALGIERIGRGYIQTLSSLLFECPEADSLLSKGVSQFDIDQPDLRAFMTTYNDGRWAIMFRDNVERTSGELLEAAQRAVGLSEAQIKPIAFGNWDLAALICETYSKGRVFLAGDAAHCLPPTRGGYGANTGIDDVHNLAWKLKFVIDGKASPSLLDTYSDERQPIGWLRHQQTFARPDYASVSQGIAKDEEILDDAGMELGQLHLSSSVCGADETTTLAKRPDLWKGQPGVRAPHAWIMRSEMRISTIDLFDKKFVLLSECEDWSKAVDAARVKFEINVDFFLVGKDIVFDQELEFQEKFGVGPFGASLVRPDGLVGWRAKEREGDPSNALNATLSQILFPE